MNECYYGCGVNEICDENFNCVALGPYVSPTGGTVVSQTEIVEEQQKTVNNLLFWIVTGLVILIGISIVIKAWRKK